MTKYISYRSYRSTCKTTYHSDPDCRHVGPNHQPVPDDHPRVAELEECDTCAGNPPSGPDMGDDCPYCGESVPLLPSHLPCEAAQ